MELKIEELDVGISSWYIIVYDVMIIIIIEIFLFFFFEICC